MVAGLDQLFDVVLHFVEHRVGQRRRRQLAPGRLGLLTVVPARPVETGAQDPLCNPPLGEGVRIDRDGVLVLVGPVPQRDPEPLAQEHLDGVAEEPVEQVDVDGLDLEVQRVGQERPKSPVRRQRSACTLEVEPVEAPRAGRDQLARHVIAWVERLQRVLDDDGLARSVRRGTDGVVHHVQQLPDGHRRRAGLVRALVVAAVGDHQVLTGGEQRIEQELTVLAACVTVAHSWVLRGDVVAVALDVAREAAVVEAEQAHDLVRDGAHGDQGAHGHVAGAEVGPRRLALQALGQERADVVTAESRRRCPRPRWSPPRRAGRGARSAPPAARPRPATSSSASRPWPRARTPIARMVRSAESASTAVCKRSMNSARRPASSMSPLSTSSRGSVSANSR